MKALILLLIIFQAGLAMAQQDDDPKTYLWKNRVLLFLTNSPGNPTLEKEKITMGKNAERVTERDIVTIIEPESDGKLHKKFNATGPFTAILLGKDGGEKWRKTSGFDLDELFKTIDAMPMRKNEKSASNAR